MRSWRLSTPADRSWRPSAAHFTFTPFAWPLFPVSWFAFQSIPESRFAWIRASPPVDDASRGHAMQHATGWTCCQSALCCFGRVLAELQKLTSNLRAGV